MSGVGAVTPPKTQMPVEPRPERDGGKRPPPPRKPRKNDDLVEVEPRNLDLEA